MISNIPPGKCWKTQRARTLRQHLSTILQNLSREAGVVHGETTLESPLAPRIEHLSLILVASATSTIASLLASFIFHQQESATRQRLFRE